MTVMVKWAVHIVDAVRTTTLKDFIMTFVHGTGEAII